MLIPTLDITSRRLADVMARVQGTLDGIAHEIVVVDNGAPPRGFAEPVNQAVRAARGRHLVIMNDDVQVLDGWWAPLAAALEAGAGCVFPHTLDGFNRDDLAAWCFAIRADVAEKVAAAPGHLLDPELKVWFQDQELLLKLIDAGWPPIKVAESTIRHAHSLTVRSEDPELKKWIAEQIQTDEKTFLVKHPDRQLRRIEEN